MRHMRDICISNTVFDSANTMAADQDQQLAYKEAQLIQEVGMLFEPANRWFSAVWLVFTGRNLTLTTAMQPQDVRTFLQMVVRVVARPLLDAVQVAAKCDQARVIECMLHALLRAWPINEQTQRLAFITFCQALSGALRTSVFPSRSLFESACLRLS